MIHASILTLTIALAVGLAVTTLSALIYFQFRTKPLLAHLYMVASINLLALTYIATLYFYQNLLRDVPVSYSVIVDNVTQVIIPALQVSALASLLHLGNVILEDASPLPRSVPYAYVIGGVIALQTALAIWQPYVGDAPVLSLVFKTVEFLTLCGAYGILVVLFVSAKRVRPLGKQKMLRLYSLVFLVLLTLLFACSIARESHLIVPSVHAFVGAVVVLCANLVPLLCRKMFFAPGFGTLSGRGAVETNASELRAAYNISPRENEVLNLICDGRSNQEIADILFLSLQTVKDHTSRIYRKIGVKNRAQLIAALKNPGASDSTIDRRV